MLKIIFVTFFIIKVINGQVVGPFQVSIRGDLHMFNELYRTPTVTTSVVNNSEINLCNGVIIHEKFLITTASCLHIKPYKPYTNISKPISPWMLYIIAGYICNGNYANNTCYNNNNNNNNNKTIPLSVNIKRSVTSIVIHDSYDPVTYANDIALLKLDRSLPLNGNMNISWIDLHNNNNKLDNCFTITRDNNKNNYLFIRNNVTIMNNTYCNNTNGLVKPDDICSQYTLDMPYNCGPFGDNLKYSLDIGSSLVCNNKLVGLLSSINSPLSDMTVNCFAKRQTTGFYINITKYILWINTEMGGQQQPIKLDGNGGGGGVSTSTSLSNSNPNGSGTVINHYYYGGGGGGGGVVAPPYGSEQPSIKKSSAICNLSNINILLLLIPIIINQLNN